MVPVPCREGMDAERKAPCVGAVRCVLEQTMSPDKLASPWRGSDCPSEVSTASRLSFCSAVSRWKGSISLQRLKGSEKRDVGVKWLELCSSPAPFNHSARRSQGENAALFPGRSLGSDTLYSTQGNFIEIWSWGCLCLPVFKGDLTQWGPEAAAAEITQCLCSTAARR